MLNLSVFETFYPGEAALLPRRQPHVRSAVRQLPVVSLAPHRTSAGASAHTRHRRAGCRAAERNHDPRRGQAHRQELAVDLRRADRGHRPRVRRHRHADRRWHRLHAAGAAHRTGDVVQRRSGCSAISARRTSARSSPASCARRREDAFTGGFDYNLRWDRQPHALGRALGDHARARDRAASRRAAAASPTSTSRASISTSADTTITSAATSASTTSASSECAPIAIRPMDMPRSGSPIPGRCFRRFWGFGSYSQGWTDDGLRIERYFETGVSFQFLNYWNFNGGGGRNGDAYDDLDTRGGPPIFKPGDSFMFFNAQQRLAKELAAELRRQSLERRRRRLRQQPMGRGHGPAEPIACRRRCRPATATGPTSRSGSSIRMPTVMASLDYVYGTLDRDVVDLTFRGTYAFNRDLTLQAYVQPFVAVGDYYDIRKLALPYSYRVRAGLDRVRPGLQHEVAARQRRPPLGVRPRQHALRCVGSLAGRLFEAGCLQTVERHRHRVRRRAHSHVDGEGQLLDQSVTLARRLRDGSPSSSRCARRSRRHPHHPRTSSSRATGSRSASASAG